MGNKIKRTILAVLVCILAVESYMLVKTKNQITELDTKLKSESALKNEEPEPIEPPVAPMITINSEINQALDGYLHKNSIVDRAVGVARGIVADLISEGRYLSDVTVSDISFTGAFPVSEGSTADMFNVEVLITDAEGIKTVNDGTYLIFYNRWDEDGKGSYYISALTDDEISEKYKEVTNDYSDDPFAAACMKECYDYLKRGQLIAEDSLEASAYNKALAFSKTLGIGNVISDKYTVSVEGDTKAFYYDTDDEYTGITIVYTYFEDSDRWAFLHALT